MLPLNVTSGLPFFFFFAFEFLHFMYAGFFFSSYI